MSGELDSKLEAISTLLNELEDTSADLVMLVERIKEIQTECDNLQQRLRSLTKS